MGSGLLSGVLQHLRGATLRQEGGALTDGQLLECFISRRDEAAFDALVRRHGPMVLGVCRRVLRHTQDAEDAFQATFLVLVRKAPALGRRELVGNWLYGVAYRAALEAKRARRRLRERQVGTLPEPAAVAEAEVWFDLRPILDQALHRLPDKYRLPVVLCDLEGRTRAEVARQLGIPEGTLSSRLATAHRLLGRRLARQGRVLSGGALAAALSASAASAAPPVLVSTVRAALLAAAGQAAAPCVLPPAVVALTEGVLQAMLLMKLKVVTALCLAVGVLAAGAGWLWHQAGAAPAAPRKQEGPAPGAKNAEVQKVLDSYQAIRPEARDLPIYQLDWVANLKVAKEKAAQEKRPLLLLVVTNSYGNLYTGHC